MSSLLRNHLGLPLEESFLADGLNDRNANRENRSGCDKSLTVGVGDAHTLIRTAPAMNVPKKTLFTKKSNTLIALADKTARFVKRAPSNLAPNQLLIGVENLPLVLA